MTPRRSKSDQSGSISIHRGISARSKAPSSGSMKRLFTIPWRSGFTPVINVTWLGNVLVGNTGSSFSALRPRSARPIKAGISSRFRSAGRVPSREIRITVGGGPADRPGPSALSAVPAKTHPGETTRANRQDLKNFAICFIRGMRPPASNLTIPP